MRKFRSKWSRFAPFSFLSKRSAQLPPLRGFCGISGQASCTPRRRAISLGHRTTSHKASLPGPMVVSTHVHEDDEWVVVPSTTELVARITVRTKRIAKSAFDDMCVRVTRLARDPKKLVRHLLVLMVVSCVLGSVASFAAARLGSHGHAEFNPWQVLDLPPHSDRKEIVRAYRRLTFVIMGDACHCGSARADARKLLAKKAFDVLTALSYAHKSCRDDYRQAACWQHANEEWHAARKRTFARDPACAPAFEDEAERLRTSFAQLAAWREEQDRLRRSRKFRTLPLRYIDLSHIPERDCPTTRPT